MEQEALVPIRNQQLEAAVCLGNQRCLGEVLLHLVEVVGCLEEGGKKNTLEVLPNRMLCYRV